MEIRVEEKVEDGFMSSRRYSDDILFDGDGNLDRSRASALSFFELLVQRLTLCG